jgi:hypothetical protein
MRLPLLLQAAEEGVEEGWHYAAWIAFDGRLLLLVVGLAALCALGITSLFARGRRWTEVAGIYLVCLVAGVVFFIWIFNEVAAYPVFVVESVFRFP